MQNNDELKSKALELISQMSLKEFAEAKSNTEWMEFKNKDPNLAKKVHDSISQYLP